MPSGLEVFSLTLYSLESHICQEGTAHFQSNLQMFIWFSMNNTLSY